MKLVIFSVEEANKLLDEIRPRMRRLVVAKRHFDELQSRVDLLKVITEGAAEGKLGHDGPGRHREFYLGTAQSSRFDVAALPAATWQRPGC